MSSTRNSPAFISTVPYHGHLGGTLAPSRRTNHHSLTMLTFPRPTNAGIALPTHQSIHNNQNAERSFPELSTVITTASIWKFKSAEHQPHESSAEHRRPSNMSVILR
ncbi:hypothetical protein A9Y81_11280 [Cutibacterium acnes]|nr:hypothetical protein A9Y81_11280 [Cutibacterium acnes]